MDYAYYLLAVCYYEQIVDEKKDLEAIINAKKSFNQLIEKYPNTVLRLMQTLKLDLINDFLASKEMYLGRYYFQKKNGYQLSTDLKMLLKIMTQQLYTPEAIHRLVEIHYTIGLKDEAEKYAKLLGYNYGSSEWYENSYKLFNKDYEYKTQSLKIQKKLAKF